MFVRLASIAVERPLVPTGPHSEEMLDNRFISGFGWGVVATLVMSALMLLGVATGMSPMPEPIPLAIVSRVLSEQIPRSLLMIVALLAHLGYGGIWAGAFAAATRPVTIWKGIGVGIFLWFLMQIIVRAFLGWGTFGPDVTPAIATATLVLHLVYGATFGWLMDRRGVAATF